MSAISAEGAATAAPATRRRVFALALPGVWLAMCADFTLQALLALWRFSAGRWQKLEL